MKQDLHVLLYGLTIAIYMYELSTNLKDVFLFDPN